MGNLAEIRKPVKEELKQFESFYKEAMKGNIRLLNIITDYIFRHKGKQMRPLFVFLTARLVGNISEKTFNAATFIELVHTATLVHDDVVDNASERRGFFSINKLWRSKIAVLVGDYLLSRGLLLATERDEYELLKIVSKAVKAMSEGELLQMEKARKLDINEAVYFDIIRQKTATLMAASASAGAHSAGADEELTQKMWEFGEKIGMAFQIKDDLFDYQNNNVGKPVGNDLKEKKITLPLIYTLKQLDSSSQKKILRTIRKKHNDKDEMKKIIHLVDEKGGLIYARAQMERFKQEAMDIISIFPDSEIKTAIKKFIDFVINRKK